MLDSQIDWIISSIPENGDRLSNSQLESLKFHVEEHDYAHIGCGRQRMSFLHKNKRHVLKLPISKFGIDSNHKEHYLWHKYKNSPDDNGIYYAPCRLVDHSTLMMWYCSEIFGTSIGCLNSIKTKKLALCSKPMPTWAWKLDSNQVGVLINGKIVAYDHELQP